MAHYRWHLLLAASHYIRVWVYETWFGFSFFGSDALLRMASPTGTRSWDSKKFDYQTP